MADEDAAAGEGPPAASDGDEAASSAGSLSDTSPRTSTRKSDAARRMRTTSLSQGGTVLVPAKPGLTEAQVQHLHEVFSLFELEDEDRRVSPQAVKSAMAEAGLETQAPELWKMLAGLNSEEPVDFQEFLGLITEPLGDKYSRESTSRLLGLFGNEAAATGSVGLDDLKKLAAELALDIEEAELEDMLDKAGANAEGRMDLDNFYNALQAADSDEEEDEED
eukprot:TRINITY_DN10436_c0_g1_i1.p1 TRINITY_DN10436_c0_g1~~TRINITY_DN10436_c0_g1_i1.p1  ORF type:complete len:221 (-),score=81.56 TRINITY_DN10436_c0_g1_i1:505-1167(-)